MSLTFKIRRSHKRHVMKSITWRLISIVVTFFLAWWITGDVKIGAAIGGADATVKMFLYYMHERFWHRLKKRKRK